MIEDSHRIRNLLACLVAEPLVHFLLLGAGLFLLFAYLDREQPESDQQTIQVTRESLLTYLQFRSRAFDAEQSSEALDRMTALDRSELISRYVREEALYREAKALGLDRNDYVAKLRLVQQLEFVIQGFTDARIEMDEAEIAAYYALHRAEYAVPAKVTFAHVFYSSDQRGVDNARSTAASALAKLNRNAVRFEQAPSRGDRFLYHVNYVDRDAEEIASHFGSEMQRAIFALQPDKTIWRGPFRSAYGFHLVMLTAHQDAYVPQLTEVRRVLTEDYRQSLWDAEFDRAVNDILQTYNIRLAEDLGPSADK